MSAVVVFLAVVAIGLSSVAIVLAAVATISDPHHPRAVESEDGSDEDAGVRHVCWSCGAHLRGSKKARTRIPDMECWDCHCSRTAPDDCPAVPSYVINPKHRK